MAGAVHLSSACARNRTRPHPQLLPLLALTLAPSPQRAKYWLTCGAQPTDRMAKILGGCNILPAKISFRFGMPKTKKE